MRRAHPKVSIIVTTLNTPKLTRACLKSVVTHTTVPYELIVVNNSPARTIRSCLKEFPGVRIVQNSKNVGYTKAANQGARMARGKYLCFLNSDTLVPPLWMERLLKAAHGKKVGAVGPLAEDVRFSGKQSRTSNNEEVVVELKDQVAQRMARTVQQVPWLLGFCFLTPTALFIQSGMFDERYFFGWEEIDWCFRLRQKGYRLRKARSLYVYHRSRGSVDRFQHERFIRESWGKFLQKWGAILHLPQPLLARYQRNATYKIRKAGLTLLSRRLEQFTS